MKIKIDDIAQGKLTPEQGEALQKYFREGGTWQELLQFSQNDAEGIYALAYGHYEKSEFEQALGAFSTLIQLNPYEAKYWMGIGATMQLKEDYEEAIAAYKLVLAIDEKYIQAHFASAQCAYAQGNKDECIDHLQKVMMISASTGKEIELSIKALQILQMIESEKGEA